VRQTSGMAEEAALAAIAALGARIADVTDEPGE
jgi:hypothetical protein